MSLQVWLPLNGNLENQGLNGMIFSYVNNNGALSINNNGKIGKCYERTASARNDLIRSSTTINLSNDISMACWAYVTETIGDTANGLVTNHSHADNTGVGITVKQISTADYRISCNTGTGSGRTFNTYYGTTNIKNAWHHLGLTYNKKLKQLLLYVDGKVEYTLNNYTNASKADYIDIFNWSTTHYTSGDYRPKCKLNDVRIYDHCLSEKEVKEISKGLILHYKLSNNYIQSVTNLLPQTTSYSTPTYAWDSTLNGNPAKVPTGWSGGYNSGVANPATGYHARWEMLNNELVMCFPNLSPSTGRWLGISGNVNTSSIPAGQKYTISFDMKSDVIGAGITGGLYYKINSSATSSNFHDGNMAIGTSTKANKWEHFSYTYTRSSSYDGNTPNCSFYFYSNYAKTATTYVKNMQLQVGSVATGYIPGGTTYQEVTEYDCSGFGNNGTISGNLTIDMNTPRYNNSYKWPAQTAANVKIISPTLTFDGKGFTSAVWVKFTGTTAGGGNYHMPLESSTGGYYEMSIATNGILRAGIYVNGTRYVENCANPSMYDNKWHHIALTYDGTKICRYVDGKAYAQTNVTGTANGTSQSFYLGQYGTTTTYFNNNVWESDARIYATALSAEDIKELYENKISIDSKENLWAYEFVEE